MRCGRTCTLSSTKSRQVLLTSRMAGSVARASGDACTAARMRSNRSVNSPPAPGEPHAEVAGAAGFACFFRMMSCSQQQLLRKAAMNRSGSRFRKLMSDPQVLSCLLLQNFSAPQRPNAAGASLVCGPRFVNTPSPTQHK